MSDQHPFLTYARYPFRHNHLNLPPQLFTYQSGQSNATNMDDWRAQRLASAARFCRTFGPLARFTPSQTCTLSHARLVVKDELQLHQYLHWFGKVGQTVFTEHNSKPIGWLKLHFPVPVEYWYDGSDDNLEYLEFTIGSCQHNGFHTCNRAVYHRPGERTVLQIEEGDVVLQPNSAEMILAGKL